MKFTALAGRLLFSLIFLLSGLSHFSAATIGYAASQGVPFPNILVPLSGLLAIAGAVSIVLGYKARIGALLIIVFLVPVSFAMHPFWNVPDPMMRQIQLSMFMKNLSMLGASLYFLTAGAGAYSLDGRHRHHRQQVVAGAGAKAVHAR
jgi:putative oxidoreductase